MAAEAEETPEEKPREGAPEAAAPAPVVQVVSPMESKDFDQFLEIFMSKAGISDRRKAAILAARALRNIGINPSENLQQAVQATQFLASVLSIIPDAGEVTRGTKDVLAAQGASRIGEKLLEEPTMEERTARLMDRMMPYKIVIDMFRGGDAGGAAEAKSAEVAALEAKLAAVEDKLKEKPIEELKGVVQGLRDEIRELKLKPKEEGGGKIEKLLEEMRGTKDSEVAKKLDDLARALTEKERAKELGELKQALDSVKTDVADKLASLESSMAEGKPQQDVMKQAGDLFNGIGNLYKGFGEMARSMGYEPKDEKLSGDIKRDIVSLGKKALDVVEKAVKYPREGAPERKVVQQLPTLGPSVVIPTESPAVAEPAPAQPPAAAAPAGKPKPAEIAVAPPEAKGPETPAEKPKEG
jgi:hypothetical protein